MRSQISFLVGCLLVGSIVIGCAYQVAGRKLTGAEQEGTNRFHKDSLKPGRLPYTEGHVIMNGQEMPIKMERKATGERVQFVMLLHDVPIDSETYLSTDSNFDLSAFGREEFIPAIPLLKFPVLADDNWEWAGKFGPPENLLAATATIAHEQEPLNIPGGTFDTLKTVVNLSFESTPNQKGTRKLMFWFDKNKGGLIKRQTNFGVTRQP